MSRKMRKMSASIGFGQRGGKRSGKSIRQLGTKNEFRHKIFCQFCGRSVLRARQFDILVHIKGVPFRTLCEHCVKLIDK